MTQQPGPVSREPAPTTPPTPASGSRPGDPSDAPTIAWTAPRTEYAAEAPPPVERVRQPGSSRARWGIALLVTALIVGVGVGAYVLLSGQRAGSSVVGYVPDQSVAYGELRLDLPGDQRQKLGEFLSKFPGFRDQSTLDVKLDDVFDRAVRAMTGDQQDWTTKIEPWFGGQLGFSMGSMPDPEDPETARFLLVASVKDVNLARTWIDDVVAQSGEELATEAYGGTELRLSSAEGPVRGGYAFANDKVLLIGDESSLRTAVDTGGNGAFEDNERYRAASGALTGDGLGFLYIDMSQYVAYTQSLGEEMGGMPDSMTGIMEQLTPDWVVMQLQARGDAIAIEALLPHMPIGPDANRAGALAQHLPPETLYLQESHDYGATLREMIALFRTEPELEEAFTQIDDALAIVGGEEGLLGWMGDAGMAVARNGDGIHGGLVFTPTDRAEAERLLGTLRSFAQLGGAQAGIQIRDEEHNGTTVTILDAGDIGDLLSMGMGMGMGGSAGLPPGTVPEGRAEIAWATTDDVVVIGVGPSFVRAVLDAGPGPSLAENARYQALIGQVGAENAGSFWLDLTGIRELAEQFAAAEPDGLGEYEREYKPYLLPLDAIVSANRVDGDRDRGTFIVTVK